MLAKQQRVSRTEFMAALAAGRRYHSPLLSLTVVPGQLVKASVVISKKVAKKAHDRNRLRRRMYAVIQDLAATSVLSGTFIVQAKPPLASLTKRQFFTEVPKQIAQLLNSQ